MKKCILYETRICNDCGECMRCDLEPEKLCDNCGKCLALDDEKEFLSMLVRASDDGDYEEADQHDDELESLSDEEKQLLAFLEAPIDLNVPEPIEIDGELYEKWERILAGDVSAAGEPRRHNANIGKAPVSYGIRSGKRNRNERSND